MLTIDSQNCRIAIAPKRGAIVTSLQVGGDELLYLDRASFDDPARNVRGGIPVLFPICGPLPGADYAVGEERFSLKQHGFAREHEWTVQTHAPDRLDLELKDSASTLASYPFPFRYLLSYQATEHGLHIEQTIHNTGTTSMPVQFGFHPYFQVGDKNALTFELPVSQYSDNKSEAGGQFTGFDFRQPEIDWAFPKPSAQQASFKDPSRNLKVSIAYDSAYSVLVFWSLKGSPFVCVEPWSSNRLAFPDGPGVHQIPAGTSLKTFVAIEAHTP